jgi:hypothetical protein
MVKVDACLEVSRCVQGFHRISGELTGFMYRSLCQIMCCPLMGTFYIISVSIMVTSRGLRSVLESHLGQGYLWAFFCVVLSLQRPSHGPISYRRNLKYCICTTIIEFSTSSLMLSKNYNFTCCFY